jgi:hypothetical protein
MAIEVIMLFTLKLLFVRDIQETDVAAVIRFEGGQQGRLFKNDKNYGNYLSLAHEGLKYHLPVGVSMAKPDKITEIRKAREGIFSSIEDKDSKTLKINSYLLADTYYLSKDHQDYRHLHELLTKSKKEYYWIWILDGNDHRIMDALPMDMLVVLKITHVKDIQETKDAVLVHFEDGQEGYLFNTDTNEYRESLSLIQDCHSNHWATCVSIAKPNRIVCVGFVVEFTCSSIVDKNSEIYEVYFYQNSGMCNLRKDHPDSHRIYDLLQYSKKEQAQLYVHFSRSPTIRNAMIADMLVDRALMIIDCIEEVETATNLSFHKGGIGRLEKADAELYRKGLLLARQSMEGYLPVLVSTTKPNKITELQPAPLAICKSIEDKDKNTVEVAFNHFSHSCRLDKNRPNFHGMYEMLQKSKREQAEVYFSYDMKYEIRDMFFKEMVVDHKLLVINDIRYYDEKTKIIYFSPGYIGRLEKLDPRHESNEERLVRRRSSDHQPIVVTTTKPNQITKIQSASKGVCKTIEEKDAQTLEIAFHKVAHSYRLNKAYYDFQRLHELLLKSQKDQTPVYFSYDSKNEIKDVLPIGK